MMKYFIFCGIAIGFFIFVGISGGLPDDVKKEAGRKTEQITAARNNVDRQKAEYGKLKTADEFAFFAVYAKRERWDTHFDKAEKMLNEAEKNVTQGKVAAFLKENKKEKAGALWIEIKKVDRTIRKALQASKAPTQRMAKLKRVQKECPQLVNKASIELGEIDSLINKLEIEFIPKAQKEFPRRSDDISKRFIPLKKMQQNSANALVGAQRELKRHTSEGNADYALLSSSTEFIKKYLDGLTKKDKAYRAEINELFQSYTKILTDMRMDYYVTAGRVSWDNGYDYPTEHNYIYPPSKIDDKSYAFFAKLKPDVTSASIPKKYWDKLKIKPRQNWYSGDTHAEYWIEDIFPKTYHKYLITQNGVQKNTSWVEVDEEDYYDAYDYLGMEIVSKPYGFFEKERAKEAAPPGMAFVGDKRYGKWRTDSQSGEKFWYYYGVYSFLNRGPSYYYYRNDWNRWQGTYRDRKPYYGGDKKTPLYGTFGTDTRTNSRYMKTNFAKRGGFKTQRASVRGAGPGRRGGGPGGKGK
ncbi:hypothetical protein QUF90_18150 [Desulfococcaceae bacterium HSG9]|nr:hypothetical protein [Desulfococcaceae bacterium HSG9]